MRKWSKWRDFFKHPLTINNYFVTSDKIKTTKLQGWFSESLWLKLITKYLNLNLNLAFLSKKIYKKAKKFLIDLNCQYTS